MGILILFLFVITEQHNLVCPSECLETTQLLKNLVNVYNPSVTPTEFITCSINVMPTHKENTLKSVSELLFNFILPLVHHHFPVLRSVHLRLTIYFGDTRKSCQYIHSEVRGSWIVHKNSHSSMLEKGKMIWVIERRKRVKKSNQIKKLIKA